MNPITIKKSQQHIPKWLSATVCHQKRIWGQIILNYPLDHIIPAKENNHNPRLGDIGATYLDDKIKRFGLIGMLTVTPLSINASTGLTIYEILSGDRRYTALKNNKQKYANIQIYEGTEKELAPLRVALNGESELTNADLALYMNNVLCNKFGMTHKSIAEQCSTNSKTFSREWVTSMCIIAENCIDEVIDAWRNGSIKKSIALGIARHYNKSQIQEQKDFLLQCINGKAQVKDISRLATRITEITPVNRRETNATKKTKERYKNKTTYELYKRYEQLKDNGKHNKATRLLIKEYEWILGINNDDEN